MTTTTLDLTVRRPVRSTIGAAAVAAALLIAISAATIQIWPADTSDGPTAPAVSSADARVDSADALERRALDARAGAQGAVGSADAAERRALATQPGSSEADLSRFGSPDAAERWTSN